MTYNRHYDTTEFRRGRREHVAIISKINSAAPITREQLLGVEKAVPFLTNEEAKKIVGLLVPASNAPDWLFAFKVVQALADSDRPSLRQIAAEPLTRIMLYSAHRDIFPKIPRRLSGAMSALQKEAHSDGRMDSAIYNALQKVSREMMRESPDE